MRHTILVALATGGLVLAVSTAWSAGVAGRTTALGGGTVRSTLNGTCSEIDKLDPNGALESSTITCTAKGPCKCDGSGELSYTSTATEPGTGADGHETATIVASGPQGAVTIRLTGKHTSLGAGAGRWKLVKSSGFRGIVLTRSGSYTTQTRTLSHVTGSKDTIVRILATVGCWHC